MKYCEIGVYHHDCWCTDTLARYPEINLRELNSRVLNKTDEKQIQKSLWELSLEDANLLGIMDHISNYNNVLNVKPIYKNENKALIQVTWKSENSTSYDLVLNAECDLLSSLYSKQGYETYFTLCENPNSIKKLLENLNEIGETKIFNISNNPNKNIFNNYNLTDNQKDLLKKAISFGYYEWPKKVNLEELSLKLKKNRRTLQDTLRKAEGKVFSNIKTNL